MHLDIYIKKKKKKKKIPMNELGLLSQNGKKSSKVKSTGHRCSGTTYTMTTCLDVEVMLNTCLAAMTKGSVSSMREGGRQFASYYIS